MAQLNLAL